MALNWLPDDNVKQNLLLSEVNKKTKKQKEKKKKERKKKELIE